MKVFYKCGLFCVTGNISLIGGGFVFCSVAKSVVDLRSDRLTTISEIPHIVRVEL